MAGPDAYRVTGGRTAPQRKLAGLPARAPSYPTPRTLPVFRI
jgi:hypothetical protein